MGTAAIPVDVYLHETWSPDREYVDGEVIERKMGERDHAAWQSALLRCLSGFRRQANIAVFSELRLQVGPTRFRVPDLLVLPRDAAREQVVTHPPLLCVEILSPEDRIGRVEETLRDYFAMGVRAVWVIDPKTQTAYQCLGARVGEWYITERLSIVGAGVEIDVNEVIRDLD